MEDEKIIDLYWERKDEAIMETQAAYGRQLQTIAQRIVQSYEDAEESVNDTISPRGGRFRPSARSISSRILRKYAGILPSASWTGLMRPDGRPRW